MKKRYLLVIILIIIGFSLIGIGLYKSINKETNNNSNKDNTPITKEDFIDRLSYKKESKKITICKEGVSNCPHALNEENYKTIEYKYDSEVFQNEVVNEFNKYVLSLYDETLNSTKYPGNCKMKDIFNYYKVITAEERIHENSKVISFTILPKEIDYCNMTNKQLEPKVFNYSKEKDKIVDLNEFKSILGINNEKIYNSIESRISDYNTENSTNYTYEQLVDNNTLKLYFLNNGELDVSYYNKISKSYDTAVVYDMNEFLQD